MYGSVRVSARMVFPDIESGAGRKPIKNIMMAQGGNRTRRLIFFFFFFWIKAYNSNQSYDGNQLSLSGFPLGPAYYDRCLYLHPKNWKKTTHVHATSRTHRAQSKNFLKHPTSNYPREERVS